MCDRVLNTFDAEVFFFQIFHISKPRTLMQNKVRGDYTPRFFFFAKPAIYTIKKM